MDLSVVLIIITIIVLSIILAAIGAYVVIHSAEEKEKDLPQIDVSGQYAVLVKPARESLNRIKPSSEKIKEWLSTQPISEEEQASLLSKWESTLEETIQTIDEGDKNGTVTYRVVIGPKSARFCSFMNEENYITREQIRNHAEILPPYVLGCDCKLVPKFPWENPGKAGWKPVIPENGKYQVPDWRNIA